jgi:hypothetical protein
MAFCDCPLVVVAEHTLYQNGYKSSVLFVILPDEEKMQTGMCHQSAAHRLAPRREPHTRRGRSKAFDSQKGEIKNSAIKAVASRDRLAAKK